jgi:hypothetical protein
MPYNDWGDDNPPIKRLKAVDPASRRVIDHQLYHRRDSLRGDSQRGSDGQVPTLGGYLRGD